MCVEGNYQDEGQSTRAEAAYHPVTFTNVPLVYWCPECVWHHVFRGVCCGLITFFLKSTLLAKSLKDHDPGKNLCRRDVEFTEQGVLISVKHNKTIQCHERSLKIPLMHTGCALCPVDALRTLWERFPDKPPHAPLFSYFVFRRLKCAAYTDFVKKVRSLVFQCGLKPDDYSGHSCRRGGCTWAWKNNMPTEYIMLQGDWRSTSWLSNLAIPLVTRWKMAKLLAESVHL